MLTYFYFFFREHNLWMMGVFFILKRYRTDGIMAQVVAAKQL